MTRMRMRIRSTPAHRVRKFQNTWNREKSIKVPREQRTFYTKGSRIRMALDFSPAVPDDNMEQMSSKFSGKRMPRMESYVQTTPKRMNCF